MRLLQYSSNGEFTFTKDYIGDDTIPPYAILSHTWKDGQEVTFQDILNGTGRSKTGYDKIQFCGQQAERDGLQNFWVDTCCINKFNAVELQESINSMFSWYQNASRCYVYLPDVWKDGQQRVDEERIEHDWEPAFRESRWFTRGWTLQELLAPRLVYFYSQEGYQLGDKTTLGQQICDITGIALRALQGTPLHEFTVEERLSWAKGRLTTRKEDRAYSLLGIFGIHMVLNYGEGEDSAFGRLRKKISKVSRGTHKEQTSIQSDREDQECIRHLRLTDPRDDKKRIEETKGGLLNDSYSWILENGHFQKWRDDQQSRLLWIKGDPGKGKTMLLCGVINELRKLATVHLAFFFCQGTDSRINSAIAVLRGLTYLLINQQPSLVSNLRKKYDQAGQSLFEDANAWVAMSDIFTNMVLELDREMTGSKVTYLVVDALDECIAGLPKLLDLIIYASSLSTRVKWLLSSRNEVHIEQKLRSISDESRLSLELKQNGEQVSRAVDLYIDLKLSHLESLEDENLRDQVRHILRQKANGTFLWVALVVQELQRPESWDPLQVVEEAPTGLYELYDRMVGQIEKLKKSNSEICRLLLSTVSVAYRPLHLAEVGSLCGVSDSVSVVTRNTKRIVAMCGSFLTIRDDQVYLIHQSAKEYLNDESRSTVFHSQSKSKVHYDIFSRSLKLMSSSLKHDVYALGDLGFPIDNVKVPTNDPLATARYSCIHWVEHLYNAISISEDRKYHESLKDDSATHIFIREQYLYWLEALSLCKSMSAGVLSMEKLEALVQVIHRGAMSARRIHANSTKERADVTMLKQLVQDARRFIMYHKRGIETYPLQVYVSALLFSPNRSLIRTLFKHIGPQNIKIRPAIGDSWSACLLTLEGHSDSVHSVAFSHDSTRLASSSADRTVKIWDLRSGECLSTLNGHSNSVFLVAFSHDSTRIVSGSADRTVKIWNVSSGECLSTLGSQSDILSSVTFSHDSTPLASVTSDNTIRIRDGRSGEYLSTIQDHNALEILSSAFAHNSAQLATGSLDGTVKVWDTRSGKCLSTFASHGAHVNSVTLSHDSTRVASAYGDSTIKIWDTRSGACLSSFKGHSNSVFSVVFSHDSTQLVSASMDRTVKIWEASSGECLSTFEGHRDNVGSVAISHDSAMVASASSDDTVKIWDTRRGNCFSTAESHMHYVCSVGFSDDLTRLASGSWDCTIKLWDTSSGECLSTLRGHSECIDKVIFSHDLRRVASAARDKTVKIWDARSGECLLTLEGHHDCVGSVAISHDSTRLVSGSWDCTVKIWDSSSGDCLSTLDGHRGIVTSVAISHDLIKVASASRDKTLKIWAARSGECLYTLQIGQPLFKITFDTTDTYLNTAVGNIMVDMGSALHPTPTLQLEHPRNQGAGISSDGAWITYNSRNLLWLPSEYRPSCSTVSGNKIGIGIGSGKIWICEVDP